MWVAVGKSKGSREWRLVEYGVMSWAQGLVTMMGLGHVDSWWKCPAELTIGDWQRRARRCMSPRSSASRGASRSRGLYRRGGVITREQPAGAAHMDCGPPSGDLELSDCLRHCLDEDGVVNGSVVSVEDMATSLSVGGMEREGAGWALCSFLKISGNLGPLCPNGPSWGASAVWHRR